MSVASGWDRYGRSVSHGEDDPAGDRFRYRIVSTVRGREDGTLNVHGPAFDVFRRRLVGAGRVLGVKFRPGCFRPFTAAATAFADRVVPAAERIIEGAMAGPQAAGGPAISWAQGTAALGCADQAYFIRDGNATPGEAVSAAMPLSGEYEPSPEQRARDQVAEYESSGGTSGTTMRGMPVIILTSRGAASGKIRKTPLMRVEHGGDYAVVASMGGAPKHPVWYHNLVADSRVELQDGPHRWDMTAREVTGEDKSVWWSRAVEAFPDYADYQRRTDREIPLFVLSARPESPSA